MSSFTFVSIISILCIICSICIGYLIYHILKTNKLRKAIYGNDCVFIKTNPLEYKYKLDPNDIIPVYPFHSTNKWSSIEKEVLAKRTKQTLVNELKGKLYYITISYITYYSLPALFVHITEYNERYLSEDNRKMLDATPFYFFVVDEKGYIKIQNNKSKKLQITNIIDYCTDTKLVKQILESSSVIRRVISIRYNNNNNNIIYLDCTFHPKYLYESKKKFWYVLASDISLAVNLRREIKSKSKLLDTLKDDIYNLFTNSNLEKSINDTLYNLGTLVNSQNGYIYKRLRNPDKFILEYEWIDDNLEMEHKLYTSLKCENMLLYLKEELSPTILNISNVSKESQILWEKHGIQTKLVLPLFSRNREIIGFLGFARVTNEVWTEDQIQLIKLAAVVINALFILQEDEKQIKLLNNKFISMVTVLNGYLDSEINRTEQMNQILIEQNINEALLQ